MWFTTLCSLCVMWVTTRLFTTMCSSLLCSTSLCKSLKSLDFFSSEGFEMDFWFGLVWEKEEEN